MKAAQGGTQKRSAAGGENQWRASERVNTFRVESNRAGAWDETRRDGASCAAAYPPFGCRFGPVVRLLWPLGVVRSERHLSRMIGAGSPSPVRQHVAARPSSPTKLYHLGPVVGRQICLGAPTHVPAFG